MIKAIDFFDIRYLAGGSPVQRRGFEVIERSQIMSALAVFDPVLAGSLPLDLFVKGSDLDILCYAPDLDQFTNTATDLLRRFADATIRQSTIGGHRTVIANFTFEEFPFEIFAQSIPVRQQVAYRHMIVEWKILESKRSPSQKFQRSTGDEFRQKIIALKEAGVKTEPAFARALQLTGDPYQALLDYNP